MYFLCSHSHKETRFNHREDLLSLHGYCSHCREPVFKTGGSLHSPCCNLYWIAVYFFLLSNSKVWKYYIKESIVKKLTGVASFMQIQKILLKGCILITRTGNLISFCTIPITEAEHTIGQFGWIDGIGEGSFVKALKLLLVETL